MAWAHVQGFNNNSASSSSSSNAFGFTGNTVIGNFLFLSISLVGSTTNPTPTVSSVTGLSNNWAKVGSVVNGSGSTGVDVEIWAGTCTTAGQAFTINIAGGPANVECVGAEFSGGSLSQDSAGVLTKTGSSTTATTQTLTTTNANDLVVAAIGTATNSASGTFTNSFLNFGTSTNLAGSGGTGGCGDMGAYRIVSATGSFSTGNNVGLTSGNWGTVIVAFQQVAVVVTQPITRHPGQHKRIPHVKAKHPIRGHIQQAPAAVPAPPLRHKQQPKRVPHVIAKRRTKSELPFHAPQATAPTPIFPPTLRHGRISKYIPHVKPKPPLKSSLELRLAQAAAFPPELWHKQPKRIPHTHPKQRLRNAIEVVTHQVAAAAPTIFPSIIQHGRIAKHVPHVKPKRALKSSLELRISQAAVFPPELRHRQPKRIPHTVAKRRVSGRLVISQAAVFPSELRHHQQAKRTPHVQSKRRIRNTIEFFHQVAVVSPTAFPPILRHGRHGRWVKVNLTKEQKAKGSILLMGRVVTITPTADAIWVWRERGGY